MASLRDVRALAALALFFASSANASLVTVYSLQRHGARNVLAKSAVLTEGDIIGGPTLLPQGQRQTYTAGDTGAPPTASGSERPSGGDVSSRVDSVLVPSERAWSAAQQHFGSAAVPFGVARGAAAAGVGGVAGGVGEEGGRGAAMLMPLPLLHEEEEGEAEGRRQPRQQQALTQAVVQHHQQAQQQWQQQQQRGHRDRMSPVMAAAAASAPRPPLSPRPRVSDSAAAATAARRTSSSGLAAGAAPASSPPTNSPFRRASLLHARSHLGPLQQQLTPSAPAGPVPADLPTSPAGTAPQQQPGQQPSAEVLRSHPSWFQRRAAPGGAGSAASGPSPNPTPQAPTRPPPIFPHSPLPFARSSTPAEGRSPSPRPAARPSGRALAAMADPRHASSEIEPAHPLPPPPLARHPHHPHPAPGASNPQPQPHAQLLLSQPHLRPQLSASARNSHLNTWSPGRTLQHSASAAAVPRAAAADAGSGAAVAAGAGARAAAPWGGAVGSGPAGEITSEGRASGGGAAQVVWRRAPPAVQALRVGAGGTVGCYALPPPPWMTGLADEPPGGLPRYLPHHAAAPNASSFSPLPHASAGALGSAGGSGLTVGRTLARMVSQRTPAVTATTTSTPAGLSAAAATGAADPGRSGGGFGGSGRFPPPPLQLPQVQQLLLGGQLQPPSPQEARSGGGGAAGRRSSLPGYEGVESAGERERSSRVTVRGLMPQVRQAEVAGFKGSNVQHQRLACVCG
ncbi:hypothetical protein TSOC_002046 [Tetrabaena socialis]|uniref:Uncharacterized protein n=1 Tax=Tetrabaena socialis TaxID=47790 RepID=A0A2J8AF51_9CHLO|nr:hypothetical protein TSOC_002046 [Tetrabaena socialis]|eukprot:PNH11153.1 hypothetical protein TSOC_002046 [Tetrabaena socialis]